RHPLRNPATPACMKTVAAASAAALLLMLLLFDVELDLGLVMPGTERRIDEEQEIRYAACVEAADRDVHAETFAEVDNPDVQREWLYQRMQAAKSTCRSTHPQRYVDVERSFEFNVVNLRRRF
ncbi:MAG: hypothetical protein AAGA61_08560, partial [Pseudomonadota bacterium]